MDSWQAWQEQVLACEKCPLCRTRTQVVPGSGARQAAVMLLGEAPGREEDLAGRPFCGAAGRKLSAFLEQLGVTREEIYLGNIVKCRPVRPSARGFSNRPPAKGELAACRAWFERELALLDPRLIVTLGATPLAAFTDRWPVMQEWHGRPFQAAGRTVFPLYHPAALIYNRALTADYTKDVAQLRRLLLERGLIKEV